MESFLNWFFEFMTSMLQGFVFIGKGIWDGIIQLFNVVKFVEIFNKYSSAFTVAEWILAIIAVILVVAIWVLIFYLIFLMIKKYIKMRKMVVSQEDMFEEIADLHKEILRLTDEKDKILAMKVNQAGVSTRELAKAITDITQSKADEEEQPAGNVTVPPEMENLGVAAVSGPGRFMRLSEVDQKYLYYVQPDYISGMSLQDICENLRNFACSKMHLYYDISTIRNMIAGMSSTKLILLQGISGTGKTSLPYCMGKFFTHDATIASVQPSWRDRTELFGYFNEFTKKFNETEVLKRIYEASYNDDMNLIILDEMNIARVEYYFAEMLSILEMPDHNEWKMEIVPNSWDSDPKNLQDGKLQIPENVYYIGTANNDDSTFAVSDKVYDRALVINLDSKGEPFPAPETEAQNISYSYLEELFEKAWEEFPISKENLDRISKPVSYTHLDVYKRQALPEGVEVS